MLTLYALNDSRSSRVEWVLRELNLDYNLELYQRDKETTKGPSGIEKIHPAGKFPILKDDDLTIAESGFIVEYLIEKYGKDTTLLGADEKERLHVKYGVLASETNIASYANSLYLHTLARPRLPWGSTTIGNKILDKIEQSYAVPNLEKALDALQDVVKANNGYYSNGHLTAADIMYSYNLPRIRERKYVNDFDKRWPVLVTYINTLTDLENKSAVAKKDLVKNTVDHPYKG